MAETSATKLCKFCYMPIDRRARRCPHCRAPLPRLSWRALPVGLALVLILLVQALFLRWVEGIFSPERVVRYAGQIRIAESRMLFGTSEEGPTVYVVGRAMNESDVAWTTPQFEVRFLDRQGELLDVAEEKSYLSTVAPRGQIAFKVEAPAERPVEDYASYEVRVRSAEHDRWPF